MGSAEVVAKAKKRAYTDGAVIQFVDRSDPEVPTYGFVIWTGMSAIEISTKALSSYSHAGLEKNSYQEILSTKYNR